MLNPFSFKGRIGRAGFLVWAIIQYVTQALLVVVIATLGISLALILQSQTLSPFAYGVAFLISISAAAFISWVWANIVKRLHDMNLSGWFSLVLWVPVINLLALIFMFFKPGTDGPNRFGGIPDMWGRTPIDDPFADLAAMDEKPLPPQPPMTY